MSTTTTGSSTPAPHHRTPMDAYLDTLEREHEVTARVLRAYPDDKLDMKPHAMSKSARELAWLLAMEQGMLRTALTTGFDWSKPMPKAPEPPATMAEIVHAFEDGHRRVVEILRNTPENQLPPSVSFFTAPRTLGDIPTMSFLWFMLHDQIHHRGQFSIYLRMAGAKVPSIYGPTADEPWA